MNRARPVFVTIGKPAADETRAARSAEPSPARVGPRTSIVKSRRRGTRGSGERPFANFTGKRARTSTRPAKQASPKYLGDPFAGSASGEGYQVKSNIQLRKPPTIRISGYTHHTGVSVPQYRFLYDLTSVSFDVQHVVCGGHVSATGQDLTSPRNLSRCVTPPA